MVGPVIINRKGRYQRNVIGGDRFRLTEHAANKLLEVKPHVRVA